MSRAFQRNANNIFIPCPLLRKQTKGKQEQGAAPGWFHALLCTCRISIKHRKEINHHCLISFQMPYTFGYNTHTNEFFLNPLLAHLHQQLIRRKCPSTSALVSVLSPGHTLLLFPSSLLSWGSFVALSLWGVTPHESQTPEPFSKAAPQGPDLTGGSSGARQPAEVTPAVLISTLAGKPNPEQLSMCGCLPLGRLQGVLATSRVHHLSCQVPLQEDKLEMASLSSAFHFYNL